VSACLPTARQAVPCAHCRTFGDVAPRPHSDYFRVPLAPQDNTYNCTSPIIWHTNVDPCYGPGSWQPYRRPQSRPTPQARRCHPPTSLAHGPLTNAGLACEVHFVNGSGAGTYRGAGPGPPVCEDPVDVSPSLRRRHGGPDVVMLRIVSIICVRGSFPF